MATGACTITNVYQRYITYKEKAQQTLQDEIYKPAVH